MAITHTRKVQRIEVYPATSEEAKAALMVSYEYMFDDTEDNQLPIISTKAVHLQKETIVVDEEGNQTTVATDISGHDPLVQTVANALWQ